MATPATALGAIIVGFDNSTAAADVTTSPGGAWVGQIPDQFSDQALPFVALMHDGEEVFKYSTEKPYMEWTRFHFEVYNTLALAESTALKIKAYFDAPDDATAKKNFAVANAVVMKCWRPEGELTYKVEPIGERTSTQELIFRVTINYRFEIVRSL